MSDNSRAALASEYVTLWAQCAPVECDDALDYAISYQNRYLKVQATTGVPWWFVAVIHRMECDGRFDQHLHNGDPLTAKTTHVPADRPLSPVWDWEISAADALTMKGFGTDKVRRLPDGSPDWTLPTVLWRLEAYNGFGSRNHGVRSCYLWAKSNLEQPGKYTSDGVWNPKAVSKQTGAAVILKEMFEKGLIQICS